MALIANVLDKDEVEEMDKRLAMNNFGRRESIRSGSKVRGDEGLGIESSEEEKVSRLVWNLINKGDCFLKLIDHPKILPLIQHLIGERVSLMFNGGSHEWKWQ